MTLFFEKAVNGPRTHALVIGVGHYRYLSGGEEEKVQTVEQIGILRQLTSPPRSAVSFAQWLKQTGEQWRAPVATIDLLVSPAMSDADAGAPELAFKPATMANIRTAYDEWKARCDVSVDDIAIFFFSGHGVEKSEHYLLAEDFGQSVNNPWLGAFAFDTTRRAFHSAKAQTQCFFVDACRKVTSSMLQQDLIVPPLDIVDLTDSADCQFDLTMKASARNEAAHGEARKPSYFTQALHLALNGGVATKKGGKWLVQSGQVSARIHDVLGMVKEDQRFPQRCTSSVSNSSVLLQTPTPRVRLTVDCLPPAALNAGTLSSKKEPDGLPEHHPGSGTPWNIDVEAGIYTVGASFETTDFRASSDLVSLDPPLQSLSLDCTP